MDSLIQNEGSSPRDIRPLFGLAASFEWCRNWNEQVDQSNDKRCNNSAKYRDGYTANKELSDVNDDGAGDEANDPASERRDSFSKNAFDNPAE